MSEESNEFNNNELKIAEIEAINLKKLL